MKIQFHRDIYGTVLTKIFLAAILVLQGAMLTRVLGAEARGLYSKLQASVNFFILFLGLGLTSAVVFYFANSKLRPGKVLGTALVALCEGLFVLGMAIAVFFLFPKTDIIFPEHYREPFFAFYLICSFGVSQLQLLASAMLRGRTKFADHNRIDLVSSLARLVLFSVLFFFDHLSPLSLYVVFGADLFLSVLRGAWFWFAARELVGEKADFHLSWGGEIKPIAQFSFLIYLSFLINFLYTRVDVWIIEYQAGLVALGVYSVAYALAQMLTSLPVTLNTILFPHVSRAPLAEGLKALAYFSRLNTTGLLLGGLFLTLLASPMVTVLYGEDFAEASLPLQILCWSTVLMSIKHLFSYFNVAREKVTLNFVAEIIGLALAVALNLYLVPRFGIVGAALASLGSNLCATALVIYFALRGHGVKLHEFFVFDVEDVRAFLREDDRWWPFEPARYILRLDDACPTYRLDSWLKLEQVLDRHGVRPIVGVIPENADPALDYGQTDTDFWDRVRAWQDKGWMVAMHGHRHELKPVGKKGNLIPLHGVSEFANHALEDQRQKIRKAWEIFQREQVRPRMWMAPAHSFDRLTLKALKEETDLDAITDGQGLYPYNEDGFIWLPQQAWTLRRRLFGVWTICLHPNFMGDEDIENLDQQLQKLKGRILSDFDTLKEEYRGRRRSFGDRLFWRYFMFRIRLFRFIFE